MASLVQGPSATGGGLPGVPCHRGSSATLDFMNYVDVFMFWAGLILVILFFRMCAAFSFGKLQFGHVLSRCVGHMLFICFCAGLFLAGL